MENMLEKIERLEREHDKLDPELVARKKVKLGLRHPDGRGVVAGITSKGQVKAYKKTRTGGNVAIPGKLFYCGYDVEDLVASVEKEKRFGFEETVYLLLTGELPNKEDLDSFTEELGRRRGLTEDSKAVIRVNSKNDDQMGALHSAVSVLHKFDSTPKTTNLREITRQCIDIIAKLPTIIAYNYIVLSKGCNSEFVEPRADLSTAENFLYMLNCGETPDPDIARAFLPVEQIRGDIGVVALIVTGGVHVVLAIMGYDRGVANAYGHAPAAKAYFKTLFIDRVLVCLARMSYCGDRNDAKNADGKY